MKLFTISLLLLGCSFLNAQTKKLTILAGNNSCLSCYEKISDYLFFENTMKFDIRYVIIDSNTNAKSNSLLISKLYLPDSMKSQITFLKDYKVSGKYITPNDTFPMMLIENSGFLNLIKYPDLMHGRFLQKDLIERLLYSPMKSNE